MITYSQTGSNYGFKDWWTVYRDGQPIHHWPTEQLAKAHADALRQGVVA